MTVTLDQLNPCATGPASSVTFTIQDAIPMTLQITPDESFVCPAEHPIDVVVTGGYPVYDYQWSGSAETDGNILVNPVTSTNYSVVVTDACGFTATASSLVSINYQPLQVSVADEVVCNGDDAELVANVSGGLGEVSYAWDGGSGTGVSYTISPPTTTARFTSGYG